MDARLLQLCLTPYGAMDHHSPPSSSVCGILQARILQWVAMPFSRGSSRPQGIAPMSLALAGGFFTTSATWETLSIHVYFEPSPQGPTPLGHHRAPVSAPCVMQQLPIS